jgi:hypothetical protein
VTLRQTDGRGCGVAPPSAIGKVPVPPNSGGAGLDLPRFRSLEFVKSSGTPFRTGDDSPGDNGYMDLSRSLLSGTKL